MVVGTPNVVPSSLTKRELGKKKEFTARCYLGQVYVNAVSQEEEVHAAAVLLHNNNGDNDLF